MSNAKPFSTLKDYSINDSINWKSRKQCNAFMKNGAPAKESQCFQQRSQKLEEVIQKIKADREIDKYDQPWRFTDSFADSKAPHFLRRNSLLFRIRSIYYREKQISFYNKLENEPQLVQAWRNAINFDFNDHLEELHGYDIEDFPNEYEGDEPSGESDMEEYDDEIPSSDDSEIEDNVYFVEEPLSSGESDVDDSYFEDQSTYESENEEYSNGSRFFGFYHQHQNMNYHDHYYYSESSAASSRASSVERSHQYDRYSFSHLQIKPPPSLTFFQQQLAIELPPSRITSSQCPNNEIVLFQHPKSRASYEKSALANIATNPNDKNGLMRSFYTNYHHIMLNALGHETEHLSTEELAYSEDVEHSILHPPPSGLQFRTYSNKEFKEMRPYVKDLLIAWKSNLDVEDEETPLDTWNRLVSESQNRNETQNNNYANDSFDDDVIFEDNATISGTIDTSLIDEATTPTTKAKQKGGRPRKRRYGGRPRKENSSRTVAIPNAKRTGTSPMNLRVRARKEVITGNTSRVVAIPVRSGPPSKKRRGRNGMITENISHDVAPKEVQRLRRRRRAVIIENTSPVIDEPPPKKRRNYPRINKEIRQCVKCNTLDTSQWCRSPEFSGKFVCKACYMQDWQQKRKK